MKGSTLFFHSVFDWDPQTGLGDILKATFLRQITKKTGPLLDGSISKSDFDSVIERQLANFTDRI